METIKYYSPDKVVDMGCGEGWLTRALNEAGLKTTGIDGTQALVEEARRRGKGEEYLHLTYEQINSDEYIPGRPYRAAVFNFSLYQDDRILYEFLSSVVLNLTKKCGIFIQTLHPHSFSRAAGIDYRSQWLEDSWDGLPGGFTQPHRWYFRTIEDWIGLFMSCELNLVQIREPLKADGSEPASIIFVLV
ncbi:MAG: class I SAM-dependent methyltransferase [Saprospiraceae bacterium]